jgi:hypothetical protein
MYNETNKEEMKIIFEKISDYGNGLVVSILVIIGINLLFIMIHVLLLLLAFFNWIKNQVCRKKE